MNENHLRIFEVKNRFILKNAQPRKIVSKKKIMSLADGTRKITDAI